MGNNHYADFKSAAAGDDSWRDEPAAVGLQALQEPVATRTQPDPSQHMASTAKAAVGALAEMPINRENPTKTLMVYDQGHADAQVSIKANSQMLGALRHLCDETEILIGFSRNQQASGMSLSPHCVTEMDLDRNMVGESYTYGPDRKHMHQMETIHPTMRKFYFDREQLLDGNGKPFGGILVECGFWKVIKERDTIPVYMGRVKYFLPRVYDAGTIYFDLSRTYLR